MWLVKWVTFMEYHPYLFLVFVLMIVGIVRFLRKEHLRLSYREQIDLERLLKGFEKEKKDE